MVVNCATQFTLPIDKLKLLTVSGLDNNRVVENLSEEFTFVLNSGNGFQIQITATTSAYTSVCGSPVYRIALTNLSLPNNYISFNGGDILTINTDQTAEIESKLTVKVKNTYYETTLIETTFKLAS